MVNKSLTAFSLIGAELLARKKYLPKDISESIDSFLEDSGYVRPITDKATVDSIFSDLADKISEGSLNETMIGFHIYNNLTRTSVRKRKRAAYSFEEIICELLGGIRVEDLPEGHRARRSSSFSDSEIKRRVERNILEKGDVLVDDQYFTVKTLVPTNLEINAGSFSSEALFKDFLSPIPQERQELGSKPLLDNKFQRISDDGRWAEFTARFKQMADEIYHCHWVVGIKDDRRLVVYTMGSSDFRSLLKSYFDDDWEQPTEFVNRFEAHALRISANPFFSNGNRLDVNLFGPRTRVIERIDKCSVSIKSTLLSALRDDLSEDEVIAILLPHLQKEVSEILTMLGRAESG